MNVANARSTFHVIRTRSIIRGAMVMGLLFALAGPGYSQEAAVNGIITDSTGGVLPGVTLTAVHEASGNTFQTVTEDRGGYRLLVRTGIYNVSIELAGFATIRRRLELVV